MFGSSVLDVAVGMVFVYLLLSLACSAAKEGLEALMKKRAIDLERGIRELLNDHTGTGLAKKLYEHPLIDSLFRGTYDQQKGGRFWTDLPSYIPAGNFALALMAVVSKSPPAANQPAPALPLLREGIDGLENPQVKQALLTLVGAAGDNLAQARANVEAWFNSSMDRVAGWYKRWTQAVIFCLGLLLVAFLNADTIAIGHSLVRDPSVRQTLVGAAQESAKSRPQESEDEARRRLTKNVEQIQQWGMPIGWDPKDSRTWPGKDGWGWVMKGVGLLLTALAISLGAPFWFDVLNKFMVVRSTVKPEEKSPKEKAKD